MKRIALTIEEMQHLKELGVDTSGASMCYKKIIEDPFDFTTDYWKLYLRDDRTINGHYTKPTFTLQDILEILPTYIEKYDYNQLSIIKHVDGGLSVGYRDQYNWCAYEAFFKCHDIINAAYNMLCWCAENGYLKQE